jgi:hypothetical protein
MDFGRGKTVSTVMECVYIVGDCLQQGDEHSQYSDGMKFTTSDRDQDLYDCGRNCADKFADGGGWWYKDCFLANLNGKYKVGSTVTANAHGIIWIQWLGHYYTLKAADMKIKPFTVYD